MIIIKRLKKKNKTKQNKTAETIQTFDLGKGCLFSPFALQNSQPVRDEEDYSFDLSIKVPLRGVSSWNIFTDIFGWRTGPGEDQQWGFERVQFAS